MSALDEHARYERYRQENDLAERRIDPQSSSMLQAVWFDAGSTQPGRLLLTLHHLIIDVVSWSVLLSDLQLAMEAARGGVRARLIGEGTSYAAWSRVLSEEARSERRRSELSFWCEQCALADPLLSERPLDPQVDVGAAAGQLSLALPTEVTRYLLTETQAAFEAQIDELLLTAFALALAQWRAQRGHARSSRVRIDLESHGREHFFQGADVSRTIGWFTSIFPVALDLGATAFNTALEGSACLYQMVGLVGQQLKRLPDRGIGYGMLRYLRSDTADTLGGYPRSQIVFNYVGRSPAPQANDWSFAPEAGTFGDRDPTAALTHGLTLIAEVIDWTEGPELIATWSWAGELFTDDEVSELAQLWFVALRALVSCARGDPSAKRLSESSAQDALAGN
jgi:non-ribosomal peptide synthase protein (TIGR01720 family)